MASSVLSKHVFSSAEITITKCHNWLKLDIVEALQFLKCTYHHNLLFCEKPSTQLEVDESGDLEEVNEDSVWYKNWQVE